MNEGNKWIVEHDDGSVTVKFDDRPLMIDGTEVKSLLMREPTVNDQLIADKGTSSSPEGEIALIANLCEIAPETVRGITMRQYRRLQDALTGFMG
ncbi:phage tail assembly protein [Pukyongiella litopenaei]|uniref:Phage tail assembly protein n=1 Tax=Pukyongiella litopenaei TaxID=2605946 RepID=A0A2S0MND0_9RHOB|nr:phage tail assembly protein [Pukyongiella litopenaei]AVO37402.1 phage tail assembly protein [Pukyongiella litopenaei]